MKQIKQSKTGVFALMGALVLSIGMTAFGVAQAQLTESQAQGALSQVFAHPASNIVNTETYYNLFLRTTTAGRVATVEMTFPLGFDLSGARLIEVSGIGVGALSVSGQTLVYRVSVASPPSIAAGKTIRIMISHIVNNGVTDPQIVKVTTKTATTKKANAVEIDGPTDSAVFLLIAGVPGGIPNGAIGTAELANNAVTSAKILDGSVGTADLASGAVTSAKIAAGAVGNGQFNTTYVQSRVAGACVTGTHIQSINSDGTVVCSNIVTVVKTYTVNAGSFAMNPATCPAGYVAVGGGVDPSNVFTMVVTASDPTVGGVRTFLLPDGTNAAATGWMGAVRNNDTTSQTYKVGVICTN